MDTEGKIYVHSSFHAKQESLAKWHEKTRHPPSELWHLPQPWARSCPRCAAGPGHGQRRAGGERSEQGLATAGDRQYFGGDPFTGTRTMLAKMTPATASPLVAVLLLLGIRFPPMRDGCLLYNARCTTAGAAQRKLGRSLEYIVLAC